MKSSKNNPNSNALGAGLNENQIDVAISKSGYPLQLEIARVLKPKFGITEEWGYIDKITQEFRSLDIFANIYLYNPMKIEPKVRPKLSLLIECKRSELPYIFFISDNTYSLFNFPFIIGLKDVDSCINITTDDDRSSWTLPLSDVLEFESHNFIYKDVNFCTTFSKCERKGKNIILSGSNSYNSLIFPLISAFEYYTKIVRPPKTAVYFDAYLSFCIGVIDAPMIGVSIKKKKHEKIFLPWVRLIKHDPKIENEFDIKQFVIDIVHKDFLSKYIENHLLPFADFYSKLILKHQDALKTCTGFISGMGKDSYRNLEGRLKQKTISGRIKRVTKGGN